MLTVRRSSFWSETYAILDGRQPVTEVNIGWIREAGSFRLDGKTFTVGREGWSSGSFFVERDGERIAIARKPSALRRQFEVEHGSEVFELAATSLWTRTYDLRRGTRRVGSVRRTSWWSRRGAADLPDHLPMEVRVFLIWLVLVMWKRSEDSSAAAG